MYIPTYNSGPIWTHFPLISNIAVQNLLVSFTSNMDLVKTFFNELVKMEISGELEFDLFLSPLHFGQTAAKRLQPSLTLKVLSIFIENDTNDTLVFQRLACRLLKSALLFVLILFLIWRSSKIKEYYFNFLIYKLILIITLHF